MTWLEWSRAAGITHLTENYESAKRAWRAGEDPTDWRAEQESA
jgi:hypothetical protein